MTELQRIYCNIFHHELNKNINTELFKNIYPDYYDLIDNNLIIVTNYEKQNKKNYVESVNLLIECYNNIIDKNKYNIYLIASFNKYYNKFNYIVINTDKNPTSLTLSDINERIKLNIKYNNNNVYNKINNITYEYNTKILLMFIINVIMIMINPYFKNMFKHNTFCIYKFITRLQNDIYEYFNNNFLKNIYYNTDTITNCLYNIYNIDKEFFKSLYNIIIDNKNNCKELINIFINDNIKNIVNKKHKDSLDNVIQKLLYCETKPFIKYFNKNNEVCNIFNPFIGEYDIMKPFIENNKYNIVIKGCCDNNEQKIITKLKLLHNNKDIDYIYNKDFSSYYKDEMFKNDICICNSILSNSSPVDVLQKASIVSKVCCFVIPQSQLRSIKTKINRQIIVSNHYVYKIIELGDNIYSYSRNNTYTTGKCVLIVTVDRNIYEKIFNKPYTKTNIYDLSILGNNRTLLHNQIIDNNQSIEYINKYINNKIKPIYSININDDNFYKDDILLDMVKNYTFQYNHEDFVKTKISDILEKINCEKYIISKTTDGIIPLYSSSKNNIVKKHISNISINDNEQYITINTKDSIGYCFKRFGPFAVTNNVDVFREKVNISNDNIKLLNIQLQYLNKSDISNAEIYIIKDF